MSKIWSLMSFNRPDCGRAKATGETLLAILSKLELGNEPSKGGIASRN